MTMDSACVVQSLKTMWRPWELTREADWATWHGQTLWMLCIQPFRVVGQLPLSGKLMTHKYISEGTVLLPIEAFTLVRGLSITNSDKHPACTGLDVHRDRPVLQQQVNCCQTCVRVLDTKHVENEDCCSGWAAPHQRRCRSSSSIGILHFKVFS